MKQLADLLRGRKVKAGTHVFVTTASTVKSDAARLGYLQDIERAGAIVLQGVCFYILQNLSADPRAQRLDESHLQLGEDREHDHRAQVQYDPAADQRLRRDRRHRSAQVSEVLLTIEVKRAFGNRRRRSARLRRRLQPALRPRPLERRHHQARTQARRPQHPRQDPVFSVGERRHRGRMGVLRHPQQRLRAESADLRRHQSGHGAGRGVRGHSDHRRLVARSARVHPDGRYRARRSRKKSDRVVAAKTRHKAAPATPKVGNPPRLRVSARSASIPCAFSRRALTAWASASSSRWVSDTTRAHALNSSRGFQRFAFGS